MSRIEIAAELCKACELCIAVCPKDCIEQSDTLNRYGVYPMRMRDGAECTAARSAPRCVPTPPSKSIEPWPRRGQKPAADVSAAEAASGQPSRRPIANHANPSARPTPSTEEAAREQSIDERQRRGGRGRHPGGRGLLFRLPDHAAKRDYRRHGRSAAAAGPRLPAIGKRVGRHQHGPRRAPPPASGP